MRLEAFNPLDQPRHDEVLALPLATIWQQRPDWRGRALAVQLSGSGRALPVQLYAHDGHRVDQLLVRVDVAAHGRVRLTLSPARGPAPAWANPLHARNVPERDDDFAWENERVTYRIYGAALQAKGEVSSGIDVWSKRPSHLVIEDWYRRDRLAQQRNDPALSYHRDNGVGLDSYEVGHSPGAGGTAAWVNGAPVYSGNATSARLTASGPLRLRFEVDYAPWRAGAATVREHNTITLDAGAHLNRQHLCYRLDGASHAQVAVGLSVHAGAQVAYRDAERIAVWDTPMRPDAGRIATGLILPPGRSARYAVAGHAAWAVFDIADGDCIDVASGAGWSKGDVPDFASWQRDLEAARRRWAQPLQLRWSFR